MTTDRNTTPPGAAEHATITALYDRWRQIIRTMDTVPALPNARRQRQFAEALGIERKVSALPAASVSEILAKLCMMRGCLGTDDRVMLESALQDLRAMAPPQRPRDGLSFTSAAAFWRDAAAAYNSAPEGSGAEQKADRIMTEREAVMVRTPAWTAGEAAEKARMVARNIAHDDQRDGTLLDVENLNALAKSLADDLDRLHAETPIPAP